MIAFIQGGFSAVGGIEVFAGELMLALNSGGFQAELFCWDAALDNENPALDQLINRGIVVNRIGWRWGCRWGLPDRIMVFQNRSRLRDADVLVLGKLLHPSVHRRLRDLGKKMILITPYRPGEIWSKSCSERLLLNSFDLIIVQAPSFEGDLRDLGYEGKVVVIPLIPPDVQPSSSWPANPPLRIGFLGRLVPDKNLEYLFQAFRILREKGIVAELHLYGDGPDRLKLVRCAAEMHMAAQVEFHGVQSRAEIPTAIDSCRVFAFSSRTEGQCLAALEILSRGRPIVATPVGAFPEILKDERLGGLAPLDDPNTFAYVLEAVCTGGRRGAGSASSIQDAYYERFPRQQIVSEYLRTLGSYAPPRSVDVAS